MIRLSGLTKQTVYTVEVAARTSAGTGVYSQQQNIETPDNVFLILNGTVIPKNGYVDINDIGFSDNTALFCITNRPGTPTSGDWYGPDGTRINLMDVQGVTRTRGSMVVRLKRTTGKATEGIYRCSVQDAASTFQTIYVGLYNTGGGHLTLSGGMNFTLHHDNSFTLTCISTGGPATTVTWTRDFTTVTQGTETVLNDPVTAQYTHTLTDRTAGLYTCLIANSVSNVSAKLPVQGPSPPSNVRVSQNGLNSILVTWTPSAGPNVTGYTIYYYQINGGLSGSVTAAETDTSVVITGLIAGANFLSVYQLTPVHYPVLDPEDLILLFSMRKLHIQWKTLR
ncbi:Peroxidasin-like protein [Geodia barretti]|uniref:Peroxidasin-like protein n=1 Tax=Geodia barretti TaxID=519541 RepID=A0AA35TL90_GEOBA|nr:Peroxidasin-like protein [Geodia barretti]